MNNNNLKKKKKRLSQEKEKQNTACNTSLTWSSPFHRNDRQLNPEANLSTTQTTVGTYLGVPIC